MNAPMLLPFLSLAMGIIMTSEMKGLWLGMMSFLIGSGIYIFVASHKNNAILLFRYSYLHYLWIFAWFLGIGAILGFISIPYDASEKETAEYVIAEGTVEDIRNSTSGDVATISVRSIYNRNGDRKDYQNFTVLCRTKAFRPDEGAWIVFNATNFIRIEDSKNSFVSGYASSMNSKGIYYQTNIDEREIIVISPPSFSLRFLAKRIRDNFVIFLEKQPFEKDTKDFMIKILAGDRNFLDSQTQKAFAEVGIAHILALSGMHIGIIAGVILFLFFPLNFIGKYKLRYLLTAIILWVYAFVTGMSPSIVRSCIMISAYIIALILERKNCALNSLSLAGFIILLISPRQIYDVGFQLSFLCVAALIIFSKPMNPIDHRRHPRLYSVIGLLNASLISTFVSWIVVAFYFKIFPTCFLPANIIILPLFPVYIVLILVSLLCNIFSLDFKLLVYFIDDCYDGLYDLVQLLGDGSAIYLNVTKLSVILWLVGIIWLIVLSYRRYKKIGMVLAMCFFTFSLVEIFIFTEPLKKGIILCNSYPEVTVKVSNGIEEELLNIPMNSISFHKYQDYGIFILDYPSLPEKIDLNETPTHVVLTGKYKGELKDVVARFPDSMIVTHSSMRKKREDEILEEARYYSLRVHSLRRQNALQLLDNSN